MNIRRLHPEHEPPLDLLLTADPSENWLSIISNGDNAIQQKSTAGL